MIWSDLSTGVGWTGTLLMALVMLLFWGAVIAGLSALFRIPWPQDRRKQSASRGDRGGQPYESAQGMSRRDPTARAR